MIAYAEVIGDPIAQSKSPVIHKYWLQRLGIQGEFVRTRVNAGDLATFLEDRRCDPDWRGCSVTIPHKETIFPLLDRINLRAEAVGSVNCVVPDGGELVGYNTDIDGVAAALDSVEFRGRKAVLIGAGGGARAVVAYLVTRGVGRIGLLVRNPATAEPLRALAGDITMLIMGFDRAEAALDGAAAIINASPLGMVGASPMPQSLLDAVRSHASEATIFDLVTTPAETDFLSAGRAGGGRAVDGLTMLIGQASNAFEWFFGASAPAPDDKLRDLLTTGERDSA